MDSWGRLVLETKESGCCKIEESENEEWENVSVLIFLMLEIYLNIGEYAYIDRILIYKHFSNINY